jgi:hypothetical protein
MKMPDRSHSPKAHEDSAVLLTGGQAALIHNSTRFREAGPMILSEPF